MQCHCPFTIELPLASVGDRLATFCQMTALLPSPAQAEDISPNNLNYLLE